MLLILAYCSSSCIFPNEAIESNLIQACQVIITHEENWITRAAAIYILVSLIISDDLQQIPRFNSFIMSIAASASIDGSTLVRLAYLYIASRFIHTGGTWGEENITFGQILCGNSPEPSFTNPNEVPSVKTIIRAMTFDPSHEMFS